MSKLKKQFQVWVLVFSGIFGSFPAFAEIKLPSHFVTTIGSALLCHDQIDSYFFIDYLNTYFGDPYKVEGGAYWWNVPGTLFGAKIDSIFVSQESTTTVFIGAVFLDDPTRILKNIQDKNGVTYQPTADPGRWVSPSFAVLLRYNEPLTPTKMFCAK